MAARIFATDYMASVREKPWHGIGAILANIATAKEMIEAARLGWVVTKEPAFQRLASGVYAAVPDEFWTVRSDTGMALGRVGKDYTVFQNEQCFELMDLVTADPNGPKWETAGSLNNGRIVWALMRLPGYIEVTPRDHVYEYVLIMTSHDGSKAVTVLYTSVRVVCNNTLNMAIRGANDLFSMKHFSGMMDKVDQVQAFLGIVNAASTKFVEVVETLQSFEPTPDEVDSVLTKLFASGGDKESTRMKNVREQAKELIYDGAANKLAGVTGSGWDVLNGITEYAGYFRTTRTSGIDENTPSEVADRMRDESRFESSFFGSANAVKDKALDLILAIPAGRK